MVQDGRKHLVLTIHKVSDVIDGGEFVAHSHPVAIPEGINAVGMHRITWPQMGPFIRREVGAMLDVPTRVPANEPLVLQEEPLAYGAVNPWKRNGHSNGPEIYGRNLPEIPGRRRHGVLTALPVVSKPCRNSAIVPHFLATNG
jgi:hypothetical protein